MVRPTTGGPSAGSRQRRTFRTMSGQPAGATIIESDCPGCQGVSQRGSPPHAYPVCHCESATGGRGNLVEALTATTNCPRKADGIAIRLWRTRNDRLSKWVRVRGHRIRMRSSISMSSGAKSSGDGIGTEEPVAASAEPASTSMPLRMEPVAAASSRSRSRRVRSA